MKFFKHLKHFLTILNPTSTSSAPLWWLISKQSIINTCSKQQLTWVLIGWTDSWLTDRYQLITELSAAQPAGSLSHCLSFPSSSPSIYDPFVLWPNSQWLGVPTCFIVKVTPSPLCELGFKHSVWLMFLSMGIFSFGNLECIGQKVRQNMQAGKNYSCLKLTEGK